MARAEPRRAFRIACFIAGASAALALLAYAAFFTDMGLAKPVYVMVALLAGAGLLALVIPFVLLANLAVLASLLLFTELALLPVNKWRASRTSASARGQPPTFLIRDTVNKQYRPIAAGCAGRTLPCVAGVRDSVLGFRPIPGRNLYSNDVAAPSVQYTINELAWRETPPDTARAQFAAFFGCSFTFGHGLYDNETFPHYFQRETDYHAYNFGFNGWGPQQMLAALQADVPLGIDEKRGIAFFTYIQGHMDRLVGSLEIHNQWGAHMPRFIRDETGRAVRRGDLTTGRPIKSAIFLMLSRSQIVKLLGAHRFKFLTLADYPLMASVFKTACADLERKYDMQGCFVVLYPGGAGAAAEAERLLPHLKEAGVSYLNYSRLWSPAVYRRYMIPGDHHPTAAANAAFARRLAHDVASVLAADSASARRAHGTEVSAQPVNR